MNGYETIIEEAKTALEAGNFTACTYVLEDSEVKYRFPELRPLEEIPRTIQMTSVIYVSDSLATKIAKEDTELWRLFVGSISNDPNKSAAVMLLLIQSNSPPTQTTIFYETNEDGVVWGDRVESLVNDIQGFTKQLE